MKSKSTISKILWPKKYDHRQWLESRKAMEGIGYNYCRVGGSDVSVITRSNSFKCPQRLYYHLTGYHSSSFITERTLAGSMMEPLTIARWESWVEDVETSLLNAQHGIKVRQMAKANYFLLNSKYPHSFASLDYVPKGVQYSPFTGEKYPKGMPVELKHTNSQYYKLWQDGITRAYYEQVQLQMAVAETDVALFLVMIDGVEFKVKEVYADKSVQQNIINEVNKFAETVEAGKLAIAGMKEAQEDGDHALYTEYAQIFEKLTPEPVGLEDNADLMKEIYAEPIDSDIKNKAGDEKDEFWMNYYLKCNKTIKSVEEKKNIAKVHLLKSCGEFEGITAGERKLVNRRATDTKKAYFNIK